MFNVEIFFNANSSARRGIVAVDGDPSIGFARSNKYIFARVGGGGGRQIVSLSYAAMKSKLFM